MRMLKLLRLLGSLCLSLPFFSLSACITISDGTLCAIQDQVSQGAICSHLISTSTSVLTFAETIDFLEAQPVRSCVPVPGMTVCADDQTTGTPLSIPARGAAIIISSADWEVLSTEIQQMCREMGKSCTYGPASPAALMARLTQQMTRQKSPW
jgi:hypothetical protein